MTFNDFAAWLLRSPFHWMMGDTLLISVTGRKSGKEVILPVNFYRYPDGLYVISSRDRVWWRNLKANPHTTLWVGGKKCRATGEVLLDDPVVAENLAKIIADKKWFAKALHIRLDQSNQPDSADLRKVAAERLFVRLKMEA